jgi:lysophospholipid acyltransferase (LPLAT)-like uncharacterized protein
MDRTEMKQRLVGFLGSWVIRLYFPLVRCVREEDENYLQFRRKGEPFIFVFWHGQLLPMVYHHRRQGFTVLVSDHKDGEYIARVIHRHGFETARGSSTRGGVKGLKAIVRAGKKGRNLAFTPDGPRGPRHDFKWGALVAAQLSGLPIVPVALGADRAWYLESWDRFMIPKPFSTLRIRYGPPRWIPRDTDEEALKGMAAEIEHELKEATLELNPAEASIREEMNVQT